MITVIASVLAIWAALFASAYVSRAILRWNRLQSIAAVVGTYAALGAFALAHFGWTGNGLTAVGGMVLPAAFAGVLACLLPDAPERARATEGLQ
jgi:hypothetical protein